MKWLVIIFVLLLAAVLLTACGENFDSTTDTVVHEGVLTDARFIQGKWSTAGSWQLTFEGGPTVVVEILDSIPYTKGFETGVTYQILEGHVYDDVYLYAVRAGEIIKN